MQATVARQSSPVRKLEIDETPPASDANMTARCEIDLSPGIVISPRSLRGRATVAVVIENGRLFFVGIFDAELVASSERMGEGASQEHVLDDLS